MFERDLSGLAYEDVDRLASSGRGLDEEFIRKMKQGIDSRIEEGKVRLPILKKNRNQSMNIQERQYKIIDSWTEERDYFYELVL